MSRLLAIPLFLFGVLFFSLTGMLGQDLAKLGTAPRWDPGKTFGFTLMVIASLAALGLFVCTGIVLVKGIPPWS